MQTQTSVNPNARYTVLLSVPHYGGRDEIDYVRYVSAFDGMHFGTPGGALAAASLWEARNGYGERGSGGDVQAHAWDTAEGKEIRWPTVIAGSAVATDPEEIPF